MTIDTQVILLDMPGKCKEAVCKNEDGSYTIFIDARLSRGEAMQKYHHAMSHIEAGDFDNFGNVNELEAVAHG